MLKQLEKYAGIYRELKKKNWQFSIIVFCFIGTAAQPLCFRKKIDAHLKKKKKKKGYPYFELVLVINM